MGDARTRAGRVLDWLEVRLNITEIFSFLTNFGLFTAELDTKKPLRAALAEALARPMPSYARWPRVLGILTMLLFLLQCLTGTLLALYYRPTPEAAYDSVRMIVRDVTLGWFVQQVHFWGSALLIVILLIRLLRFFYDAIYKPPRELLWVIGFLLFIATTHADFTGKVMTFDSRNYWAATRSLEIFSHLPVVGSLFVFLAGGGDLSEVTLVRFYLAHIFILPTVLFILFYLHFQGVRHLGLSHREGERSEGGRLVYHRYLLNLSILLTVVFALLVTVAVLLPHPFAAPPDFLSTPPGARPPWYLLPVYGFFELLPRWVPTPFKGSLVVLLGIGICLLPFLDRSASVQPAGRKGVIIVGAIMLLLALLLGVYGYQHA